MPKYVPKNIFKMAVATNENILVALSSEQQNCLYVINTILTTDKNYKVLGLNELW